MRNTRIVIRVFYCANNYITSTCTSANPNMRKPLLPYLFLTLTSLNICPAIAEVPAMEALSRLKAGNARFVADAAMHPHASAAQRNASATGQQPFAVVLGCADSRTGPEMIFDQGIGDLFVTRLAGNVADDAVLGSIEFAVTQLGARLIVVLGHENCGAVAAAVKGVTPPSYLGSLITNIHPAVAAASAAPGDLMENAIHENIQAQVQRLKTASKVLAPLITDGSLQIIGARYDLHSGLVTFFP